MLIAFSINNRRILKVKRNSNYQKWAHLLSFCCLTFVSTFITTRSRFLYTKEAETAFAVPASFRLVYYLIQELISRILHSLFFFIA